MNRILVTSVVDPGISRGRGANSKGGCEKLLFGHFFPKKTMKLKEFGPRRGHASLAPLDPPMHSAIFLYLCVYLKCVIE